MKTEIQETELYKKFKEALNINDMLIDDNPFVVECCKIALQESRKAFEAGREIVVDMTEDLECYKHETFEDYLASEKQQPLTK